VFSLVIRMVSPVELTVRAGRGQAHSLISVIRQLRLTGSLKRASSAHLLVIVHSCINIIKLLL